MPSLTAPISEFETFTEALLLVSDPFLTSLQPEMLPFGSVFTIQSEPYPSLYWLVKPAAMNPPSLICWKDRNFLTEYSTSAPLILFHFTLPAESVLTNHALPS